MSDFEEQGSRGGVEERQDEGGVQGAFSCDAIDGALAVSRDVIDFGFTGLGALSSCKGRRGLYRKPKVNCRYIVSQI
jgi:hypothetical protein